MTLKQFAGAVAVITGGASGIGLATARALYAQGAHLVLADINADALVQAGQQVHESNPSSTAQVLTQQTDVTNEAQVNALMQQALTINDRIDLVVTSAGIGRGGAIDTFTGAEMQTLMNVNFMGTYHCVRAALPTMRKQQGGHFILLSSVAGKLGAPLLTGYCASKWAIRGFSSALRSELYGTNIGVTTVYPAWVDTPMIHQEGNDMNNLNIVAMLTPEQVADEMLNAAQHDVRDLTLAPNPDIALGIQLTHDNPDQAEDLIGASYFNNLQPQQ